MPRYHHGGSAGSEHPRHRSSSTGSPIRRLRRRITAAPRWRTRTLRNLLTVGLCVATATTASALLRQAADGAARWGQTVTVAVARRDLPAGSLVEAADVQFEERPRAHTPAGALEHPPTGERTRTLILAGEPIVAARTGNGSRISIQLGSDRRAIDVTPHNTNGSASAGDRVDVWSAPSPLEGTALGGATKVAAAAEIVEMTHDEDRRRVTLSVHRDEEQQVAEAAISGPVVLVLLPSGSVPDGP